MLPYRDNVGFEIKQSKQNSRFVPCSWHLQDLEEQS